MTVAVRLAGTLLVLAACKHESRTAKEPLRVAAASDLTLAFKEVGAAFEKQSGQRVDFSFGSTGVLAKQVSEGAPFDVFAAANLSFVDDVVRAGACDGATKALYGRGGIVVWSKEPERAPRSLADLADPRFGKIAIANPEHAPYGRAAREALTSAGVWKAVEPRLVYGENIQQTMMFAASGNADVAIVARSLATTSGGSVIPIDASLHSPLDQAVVACGQRRPAEARAFVAFVTSDEGQAILRRFGFSSPR